MQSFEPLPFVTGQKIATSAKHLAIPDTDVTPSHHLMNKQDLKYPAWGLKPFSSAFLSPFVASDGQNIRRRGGKKHRRILHFHVVAENTVKPFSLAVLGPIVASDGQNIRRREDDNMRWHPLIGGVGVNKMLPSDIFRHLPPPPPNPQPTYNQCHYIYRIAKTILES